ncbi:Putative uncharacterized protein OS=[Oscillatoria] sp. PCC 6506 GN=OSCI_1000023 PE=4 SV=1 [Gemmata massiliana]|uniref:Uncharacterized protein n=1 Tax=Gemmata massiliana TaxID=1210884 RepID=A0A6P2DCQ0_9BACT|nr:hypothetical protein [Gemmata massiliana]VTR98563.1 Putative uncharacterized protein OS=[Oscillatoria] sp. PCC 6506 GN=OSCI_1000023 PE=4 SV=1 [Gemmata massiliana]
MKVRCRTNRAADLTTPWLIGLGDGSYELTPGREYVVYALQWSAEGVPGYILCHDGYGYYPLHYPAELFEVTDPRSSQYWVVTFRPARTLGSSGHVVLPEVVVGFPEWSADWGFHYWVTEGREPELSTWQRYKRLIDEESGITEDAVRREHECRD